MLPLGDFFREYGTPFATAIAVINTVITATIGQYFKESPRARAILVIASFVFGGLAVGATFYSQYEINAAAKTETSRRIIVRERIGKLIAVGNNLIAAIANSTQPISQDAADKWSNQAEEFLLTNLVTSFVLRFRDANGIPYVHLDAAKDDAHQNLWFAVHARIVRLEEFSQQLPL